MAGPVAPEVVRSVPLFARLPEEDVAALAARSVVRLYSKGETLFVEGEPAEEFHTLVRGRVKIAKRRPSGGDLILAILGPGDPVGAVAVYLGGDFPATAEALEDTVCLSVPKGAFYLLLEESPRLVRGLLLGLTHRLMELTTRLATLTGGRVEARFARLFLKLCEEVGREADGATEIPIRLSRQELADLTGTTIETCIRIMSRWEKEAVVHTGERGFRVLDLERLRVTAR